MSQVFAFSKPGIEVTTATDPDDFVFHSDYDTLKYGAQGAVVLNTNLANYYYVEPGGMLFPDVYYNYSVGSMAHNLGYVPYFAGYGINFVYPTPSNAIQLPFAFGDALSFEYSSIYADDTNLYFMSHFSDTNNSGTVSKLFGYRIFKNDLGL